MPSLRLSVSPLDSVWTTACAPCGYKAAASRGRGRGRRVATRLMRPHHVRRAVVASLRALSCWDHSTHPTDVVRNFYLVLLLGCDDRCFACFMNHV